jgi:arylsulfatase A-like enzyme
MNGSQRVTLPSRAVAAALIGALLSLLDFALFEIQGNLAGFREYVLYKPSLFGLSLLSFQLLAFVALGILPFCLFSLAWVILGKLVRKRWTLPLLPISSATLALGTIALRVYMNSRQAYGLLILVIGSAALVFWALVLERSHVRPRGSFAARLSLSPRSQFFVLFLLIVVSLFSPDVYSGYLRFPYASEKQHGKAPNVLFIVLDTVRADHLSCYGYEKGTTPNIDRIAREGVLFSNAFSAAPWTLPSHASMFTGLYPSQHQADWGHVHLDEGFPTLAEHFRDVGYETVGFSENLFVGRTFGLARGFGEFHETWRRPLVVRAIAKAATRLFHYKERLEYADRSVGLFERWLTNNNHDGKPFFAFMNLMAAHLPRYPRPAFGSGNWTKETLARIEPVNLIPERYYLPQYKLTQQELAIMVDIYDSDISYVDSQIGDLMSFLARAGILDETIVVLVSDHGENFGEHGLIEHQFCLYDTLLRVPLILRYPAMLKPDRIEKRVSTVSLFKTVMAMVGTTGSKAFEDSRMGALGQLQGQEYVIAECGNGVEVLRGVVGDEGVGVDFSRFDQSLKCVIKGDYKFIWSSNGKNKLYRIGEDPREAENIIEKEQDQARALDQLLKSWELSTPSKNLF